MTKNFLLLIIFLIFGISLITFILILRYINPYEVNNLILIFFWFSFILTISTFFTFIFYIIKKIHYRWEVLIRHIWTSFRQWLIIAIYFVLIFFFYKIKIPIITSSIILLFILLFIELFIQNMYS